MAASAVAGTCFCTIVSNRSIQSVYDTCNDDNALRSLPIFFSFLKDAP